MHPAYLFRQHHPPLKSQKRFGNWQAMVKFSLVIHRYNFLTIYFPCWMIHLMQAEEDMDRRPKRRIWNGEDYGSDHDEDEKLRPRSLNIDGNAVAKDEMR